MFARTITAEWVQDDEETGVEVLAFGALRAVLEEHDDYTSWTVYFGEIRVGAGHANDHEEARVQAEATLSEILG